MDWNHVDSETRDLAYVTMGSWRLGEESPFAIVNTILDARKMIPERETLEVRHLLEFACLKLPAEVFESDEVRTQFSQSLVASGVVESDPWRSKYITVDGTRTRFLAYRHAGCEIMASSDVSRPVIMSVLGPDLESYELADGRPAGEVTHPT